MLRTRRSMSILTGFALGILGGVVRAQAPASADHEAMFQRYLEYPAQVRAGNNGWRLPHWMADGNSYWYVEGGPDHTVIYKVDPLTNTRSLLLDTAQVRAALAPFLGSAPPTQGLPFQSFNFVAGEKAIEFSLGKNTFVLQLDTYRVTQTPSPSAAAKALHERGSREVQSPDGRWFAGVKETVDYNIYLRAIDSARTEPLTTDGKAGYNWWYDDFFEVESRWSPDSRRLAVMKLDYHEIDSLPIVHWTKAKVDVGWWNTRYLGPWDQLELYIIDIATKRQIRVDTGADPKQLVLILHWHPDGSRLFFLRMDRYHKKLELMSADSATGASRVILTETSSTFIEGFRLGSDTYDGFTLLPDGKRFLWLSERDGWRHIYLYNLDGTLIRDLTPGRYPVNRVLSVDEQRGWVYFQAQTDLRRPYDTHICRVNLDGTGFRQLTEGTGLHNAAFSPSLRFFQEWNGSANRPGATELRTADGKLVRVLNPPDTTAFASLKWRSPEEFVVKAADGETDLYGVLFKPYDFDPARKYPVIDIIYGGPSDIMAPRHFLDDFSQGTLALAQLGFIVIRLDARGTPGRGKAFQDVTYGKVGRTEIPDHVAALKQLGAGRPYLDLQRVGVKGGSWGGYFATRAMLLAPETFKVGVAGAGMADLNSSFFAAWLGDPAINRAGYEYAENTRFAGNLEGNLLLVHGTSDVNVLFNQNMRIVDALMRAGKFFDMLVLPEGTHHSSEFHSPGYVEEAMRRYLVAHLKPE